ncbi:MAG: O-antigen ligase family protein [candidate division Zixibacteria bacterium]|nr:O-antigen ligase family protein [candidate division Zixibacteria bacterium]
MMVYIFLAFAMIAFISMIINSRYSIEAFLEVARYFTLVGLFLISYKYISSEARIRRILLTIMFISIVGAAYSYWAVFTMGITGFILAGLTALRGFSELVINPNTIAMMIGNSLPLLLAYLMLGKNKKYNLIAILLFIFLAGIWLLWNSRSTYVFFFVAFLVLLAYHPKRLKYFSILITAMACIVLIVYISPALQGFLRLESGLSYRDQLWGAAIDIFKRNPAFGAGPTSYGEMKFGLMEPGMARSAMGTIVSGAAAHNLLVTKAAELGIGAVLIILTFWSLVIYYFFRNIKIMKGTKFYFLYIGCFASFMGLIVRSFFELGGFFGIGRLSDNLVPMLIVAIIIKLPVMQSKLQDYNYSHD